MPTYLAHRDLSGLTLQHLSALQQKALAMSAQFTAQGKAVRYLRSTCVLEEAHCMCLFEAPNPKVVQELNEAAQLPFTRIVEAMEVTP
jgi:hypothetical protein